MARLKIEINDKQGPRDIPLEYWASEKCGELHRIRIKSCIYTDCPDYKKTQVKTVLKLMPKANYLLDNNRQPSNWTVLKMELIR